MQQQELLRYIDKIRSSGKTIYEFDEDLYLSNSVLEEVLSLGLLNQSFKGLPLRTRSKVVKTLVCDSLGYPVPKSFTKCQPRFMAQDLDIYIQKSNNLQIWNEVISADRRYALIKLSEDDQVIKVKVLTGSDIAKYDTTGTITIKHQAILRIGDKESELISNKDSDFLNGFLSNSGYKITNESPTGIPEAGKIFSIETVFSKLQSLVGNTFVDSGFDQERNRGGELHKLVCRALGYSDFSDNGQFPDVLSQLLEVKLQTSPTIDLGAMSPHSSDPLPFISINNAAVSPSDIRYAVFYGVTNGEEVQIKNFRKLQVQVEHFGKVEQ